MLARLRVKLHKITASMNTIMYVMEMHAEIGLWCYKLKWMQVCRTQSQKYCIYYPSLYYAGIIAPLFYGFLRS